MKVPDCVGGGGVKGDVHTIIAFVLLSEFF